MVNKSNAKLKKTANKYVTLYLKCKANFEFFCLNIQANLCHQQQKGH